MTDLQWENVLSRVGVVLNFGIVKKERIKNSKIAKLIAAVPFLADCNKAFETAFSHLLIYLMSIDDSAKDIFFHKEEDDTDIYLRLFPISGFSGGKEEIIQCCMDLIALTMLSNYKNDRHTDENIGKYNPLTSGEWNYDSISDKLIENIISTATTDILNIYTTEDALEGYWN